MTFIVGERHQFLSFWLHPNIGRLPGVIVPVFIEFTDLTRSNCHVDILDVSQLNVKETSANKVESY